MPTPTFNVRLLLQALADQQVRFIVIGGVAAALQGATHNTFDLDIVHSREPENLNRLLAALRALGAYYREQPDRRLRPELEFLSSPGHGLFMTSAGSLDVLGTVSGDRGYEELLPHAVNLQVGGKLIRVLDLEMLIRLKEETGREKDKAVLPELRRALAEKQKKAT